MGAGRPKVWTEDRVDVLKDLFSRFLRRDPLFEDDIFSEIAEAVPTLSHFIATLHFKWDKLREEYTGISDVERPPAKSTILEIEELSEYIQSVKVIQERGLLYGGLSGRMSGSIVALMLQDHGYVKKNANELTGGGGGDPIVIEIVSAKNTVD